MKVCVLSDTHGDLLPLIGLKEKIGKPDAVFHLGDCCRDGSQAGLYLGCPVYQVKGNCDYGEHDTPEELCFRLAGKRFLLLHGHRVSSENALFYKALEKGADAVLSGHTHVRSAYEREGVLVLNPGSLSAPRYMSPAGCALIEWEEGGPLTYRFLSADREK